MPIDCPHCRHTVNLEGIKAGRYTLPCPKCGNSFVLTVTGDEGNHQLATRDVQVPAPPIPTAIPIPEAIPAALPANGAEATLVIRSPGDPLPVAQPAAALEATDLIPAEVARQALAVKPEPVDGTVAGGVPNDSPDFVSGPLEEDLESGAPAPMQEAEVPPMLGGYEIIRKLGSGGMGAVYLARQVSLDRPVALKVMHPEWARDPAFLARFTREAYAAAQLIHHNIVQIYDIGEDLGIHFFSMEFVTGKSLTQLVREKGKLDVEEAVGYVLQAARGLKFAHDQGMVHRDVKPDNLMLNDLGVVKVADLGLVKTPDLIEPEPLPHEEASAPPREKAVLAGSPGGTHNVTRAGMTMGTPAYMAPEQARNASTVDRRADVYSLGCTLYVLLTGRPPFRGKTAMEIMIKHVKEPLVPPDRVVSRVPKAISNILMKMMAKKPEDRFADMGDVIDELEAFLGVVRAGPFTPSEEHIDALEKCVKGFAEAPAARLQSLAVIGFLGGCGLLIFLGAFLSLRLAGGLIGFVLLTSLFTFFVVGFADKTHLYVKVRELVLGAGRGDWLTWGLGLLLLVALLWVAGLLEWWLFFLVLGAVTAVAYHLLIHRPLQVQRGPSLAAAKRLLRALRMKGVAEDAVRQFVCKYGGERWEEFYEALFGYEALLFAREHWARTNGGKPRPTFAGWRDPLVQWIESRQRVRQERREKKHLQAVEQKKLQAEGKTAKEAKEEAAQVAAVMVHAAAEIKHQTDRPAPVAIAVAVVAPADVPTAPAVSARRLVEAAEKPKEVSIRMTPSRRRGLGSLFGFLFGPQVRFLTGAGLLVLCFLWMAQNELSTGDDWQAFKRKAAMAQEAPLKVVPVPFDRYLSGFNVGAAGLILVLSALTRGGKSLFFVVPAVALALAGPYVGVPDVLGIAPVYVSSLGALALAEFGWVFAGATRGRP